MTRFIRVVLLTATTLLPADVLCALPGLERSASREKRSLVYTKPVSKVQAIMGAGFPVDLHDESVIIGVVIKALYLLPRNASDYTNPTVHYERRKRDLRSAGASSLARLDVYKVLEQYAESYGLGGKECMLRTICELSHTPVDKSRGIMEEILHVLFTPTSTRDILHEHYYEAQMIGRKAPGQCANYFSGCTKSFVDLFTV